MFKKERSRASNIAVRSRAKNRGLVVNDIAFMFKGGSQLPSVPVSYSDEVVLNTPSIALEDVPTDEHRADSDLQDVLDSLRMSIANKVSQNKNVKADTKSAKDNVEKEKEE